MPNPNPDRIKRIRKDLQTRRLKAEDVGLAAFLRDPDAAVALGEPIDPEPDLVAWSESLRSTWGEHACGRATIAWARAALIRWEKRPLPSAEMRNRLRKRPYELLRIAEQLMLGQQMQAMILEGKRLRSDTHDDQVSLTDEEGVSLHAAILSLSLQALEANGTGWGKAFTVARQDIRNIWPNEIRIRRIVEIELVPWTLKEHDPLRERPTRVPD